jgi:hypothetical protein
LGYSAIGDSTDSVQERAAFLRNKSLKNFGGCNLSNKRDNVCRADRGKFFSKPWITFSHLVIARGR